MALKNYTASGFFTNNSIVPASTSTQIGLFDTRFTTVSITKEVEEREVRGVRDGSDIAQVYDTFPNSITYGLSTEIEAIDSDTLALMFGETWAPVAAWNDSIIKQTTVPTATPYEFADNNIVAGMTAVDVQVSINENGSWGFKRPLEVILTGNPTLEQVRFDVTNSKLIFAAGLAGAPIKYSIRKARTNIDSLGVVQTPKMLDDLKFFGHIAGSRKEEIIVEVDLTPSGGWELAVGDESSVTLEFKATAKGANRSAVRMYRLAA
jgi:hypothetical protein